MYSNTAIFVPTEFAKSSSPPFEAFLEKVAALTSLYVTPTKRVTAQGTESGSVVSCYAPAGYIGAQVQEAYLAYATFLSDQIEIDVSFIFQDQPLFVRAKV